MAPTAPAWLQSLDFNELMAGTTGEHWESVNARLPAMYMSAKEPTEVFQYGRPTKWDAVWDEVYLLVCTKDAKYRPLRRKLAAAKKQSTPVAVAVIAAKVGEQCGLLGAALVPVISAMLSLFVSVGANVICHCIEPDCKAEPQPKPKRKPKLK
jgi:hypothetical protein